MSDQDDVLIREYDESNTMSENDDIPYEDFGPTSEPPELPAVIEAKPATLEPAAQPAEPVKSAQDMRVVQVSEALVPAYQKASTLVLSDAEVEALTAPFPDEAVEVRPHDGLIYLPHIHISQRLNKVFKPGQWALIRRRDWYDEDTSTMYGEYVLVIRGCYVGESVGGHPYVKKNPKVNLSDALESTAAEALRRIAGKRLSCGEQCWNPEYARAWEKKHKAYINGKWTKKAPQSLPEAPGTKIKPWVSPDTREKLVARPSASEAHKARLLQILAENQDLANIAREFFEKVGAILSTESLVDVPLTYVPVTAEQKDALIKSIDEFAAGSEARMPYPLNTPSILKPKPPRGSKYDLPRSAGGTPENEDQSQGLHGSKEDNAKEQPWYPFIVPVPRRGQTRDEYLKNPDTIGSLYEARHGSDDLAQEARQRLYGFLNNYEPKGWVKKDGTQMPPSETDKKFRMALDMFGDWWEQNHPGEKI